MAGEIYMLESKIGSWDSGMRLRDWSGLASIKIVIDSDK